MERQRSTKKRKSKSSKDVTPKKKTKAQTPSTDLPELDAPGKFVVFFQYILVYVELYRINVWHTCYEYRFGINVTNIFWE